LRLEDVSFKHDDWDHLTRYLAHQTSDNQNLLLEMAGDSPYLKPGVVEVVEDLVDEFITTVTSPSSK